MKIEKVKKPVTNLQDKTDHSHEKLKAIIKSLINFEKN